MSFCSKFSAQRKILGLSQSDLAERLGVSKNTIFRFESGASVPDARQLVELARMFKCSLDWLLFADDSEPVTVIERSLPKPSGTMEGEVALPSVPGVSKGDRAFRVGGDAMAPRIDGGELVVVQTGDVPTNCLAAIYDQWGGFQVRWKRQTEEGVFYVAENPAYAPLTGDGLTIIGRVVSAIRIRSF